MKHLYTVLLLILMIAAPVALAQEGDTPGQPALPEGDLPYQNPELSPEERAADLLQYMTLDEKIGQMTLIETGSINPDAAQEHLIGGILSGGGGVPASNTVEGWAERTNAFVDASLDTRLGIPIIYGVDAVHGHNNVYGAVIFPHNIGLGATRNPDLLQEIGEATACDMVATGIYWNYAPVLAVPQDIRWGRTYEGYAQDTEIVTELALAFMQGLQGVDLSAPDTVLATPKHYIADGGALWGTSTTGDYRIDQGDAIIDEATLREIHLPPYQAAIDAGAMSVMASFSSWNSEKVHGNEYLINDVLKDVLGFEGFVVSDWQAIDQITPDYYDAVVQAINAGIDMNMVPYDYTRFINTLREAVENGDVPMERIDDAVSRILKVKFMLGLFKDAHAQDALFDAFSNDSMRELARQAVAQSAVLLKNEGDVLPVAADAERIFIGGMAADDIGIQSGGWTISWQGRSGGITIGTSIRDAIEAKATGDVYFNRFANFERVTDDNGEQLRADVGFVIVGEMPYAEGVGDDDDLQLGTGDIAAIERMNEVADTVVLVLVTGRPLIISDVLDDVDAVVVAWLPGSEGEGVADVLFGEVPFTGTLSFVYPESMEQVPLSNATDPLYPIGYGIITGEKQETLDFTCNVTN